LSAARAEVKEIEVKALNAVVKFRVLTGKARDEFHAMVAAGDKSASYFEAALVAAVVVDDEHKAMFTAEDVAQLQESNANALAEVAKHAMTVNGIGVDAQEQAAKN
jgi:hypothetical protein